MTLSTNIEAVSDEQNRIARIVARNVDDERFYDAVPFQRAAQEIIALSRRSASNTGGVEVKSEMHRAASALLNTLWQTVYSGTKTFEENWAEMDRRFPQARWLQEELKASRSLAAEAEPVALDRDMVMLSASERACYEYPDDQGKRAAFIFGAALFASYTHPSSPVSAEVTITDEMVERAAWAFDTMEQTQHYGAEGLDACIRAALTAALSGT